VLFFKIVDNEFKTVWNESFMEFFFIWIFSGTNTR